MVKSENSFKMFPKKLLIMKLNGEFSQLDSKMQIREEMGHQAISQKGRPPTVPSKCLADDESQKCRLTDT